jgi:hypothetical protein
MKTIALTNMVLLVAAGVAVTGASVANDMFLRGSVEVTAGSQCSRCLVHNCCSNGLKCIADGHDGACTKCTGEYESVCGDKCCKAGQECHGDSSSGYGCTIPLFQTGGVENAVKVTAGSQCSRCLVHNCCSNGLKCIADGHDGACTKCTGEYESVCGDKCCKAGQECHGDSSSGYGCTIPLFQTAEY